MVTAIVILAWLALSGGVALLIGPGIRIADGRAPSTDHLAELPTDLTVEYVLGRVPQPSH